MDESAQPAGLPGQLHDPSASVEQARELARKQREKLNEYKNTTTPTGSVATATSSTSPMASHSTLAESGEEPSRARTTSGSQSTGTSTGTGTDDHRPPLERTSTLMQSSFNVNLNGSRNVTHFVGTAWRGDALEQADAGGMSTSGTQTDPNDLILAGAADTFDEDWHKGSMPSLHGSFMASTSALIEAVRQGNREKVKILSEVIDVNAKDAQGRSVLMHAIVEGQVAIAKFLLERKADLNYSLADGSTAMHYAASSGHPEVVEFLIAQGANPIVRDAEGRTPLHWATMVDNTKCLRVLIKHLRKAVNMGPGGSASLDIGDLIGMTPLMFAAYNCRGEHGALLIKGGADQTARDIDGRAAIHHSVAHKFDLGCLPLLLNIESSKWRDAKGKSVIHYAAEQGAGRACRLIISLRADAVHDTDLKMRTPLLWAAACGQVETVRVLLEANANANHADADGHKALDYAAAKKFHYCYLLLNAYSQTKLVEASAQAAKVAQPNQRRQSTPEATGNDDAVSIATEGSRISYSLPQLTSAEYDELFKALMRGCYLLKYPEDGKGSPHRRFFAVDVYSGRIAWGKTPEDVEGKASSGDSIIDVSPEASKAVRDRKDYEPQGRHRFNFSIQTSSRWIDLVGSSQAEHDAWVYGIRGILSFGTRVSVGGQGTTVRASRERSGSVSGPPAPRPAGLTMFFESVERAEREHALDTINEERKKCGLPPIRDEAWNSAQIHALPEDEDEGAGAGTGAPGPSATAAAAEAALTMPSSVGPASAIAAATGSLLGTSAQVKAMVDTSALNRIDESTLGAAPSSGPAVPMSFPKASAIVRTDKENAAPKPQSPTKTHADATTGDDVVVPGALG